MKYCTHCGAQLVDEAVICIHCGCATNDTKPTTSNSNRTLCTVAKVFMIISTAAYPVLGMFYCLIGLSASDAPVALVLFMLVACCIPLSWCLPMTLKVSRRTRNGEPIGTALKVCTLIFVNLVAGILLLCANDE